MLTLLRLCWKKAIALPLSLSYFRSASHTPKHTAYYNQSYQLHPASPFLQYSNLICVVFLSLYTNKYQWLCLCVGVCLRVFVCLCVMLVKLLEKCTLLCGRRGASGASKNYHDRSRLQISFKISLSSIRKKKCKQKSMYFSNCIRKSQFGL